MKRARFEGNRDFYLAVGQRIAKARSGRMTQEALAQKTTLTRTSIVNIEKGRQQILVHTLIDIAQALAVPLTELVPDPVRIDVLSRAKPSKTRAWVRNSLGEGKR